MVGESHKHLPKCVSKGSNTRLMIKVYVKWTVPFKRGLYNHLCIDVEREGKFPKPICNEQLFNKVSVLSLL